jgi:hypothetical protein
MTDSILGLIFFVLFIISFFVCMYAVVMLKRENLRLQKEVSQGILDLLAMRGELEKIAKNSDHKKIEETEGFLKFVSQSRDWAFQYIERVQIAIKNFQDTFHPFAIEYYKDKDRPVSQEEFGKVFEAYKKLIIELPDEGKK